jgi:trehalose synthase
MMGRVAKLTDVEVAARPVDRLADVVGPERIERLLATAAGFRDRLGDRTVWNVSSTAAGGGVAEMLQTLVGYVRALGVDTRWTVISGEPEFFTLTKRLHNRLHGQPGDGGNLGEPERLCYERVTAANAGLLLDRVKPADLVLLHDPQTAGLAGALLEHGARVVWRCHIGIDTPTDLSRSAWEFLRPYLRRAERYVFSRQQYAPEWLDPSQVRIIPPSIDPLAPKNSDLDGETVRTIVDRIFRTADVVADLSPTPADRLVLQVSRWDRLKDMAGVMEGFARYVVPGGDGYLVLAGPAVHGVTDDPEGAAVYQDCRKQWDNLPAAARQRIALVTLPMDDVEANARMVNALQRQATVITQKSLAEGFGLTVAEGMWKGRATIGSAVGGIRDQIVEGTGVLLPDPRDLPAFGAAVRRVLDEPGLAERMGQAAHEYVRGHFVTDIHLIRYAELFGTLIS